MGAKFSEKVGSAISGMALAANQFLAAAALMTGKLFQPQISVKNGPDGKIRLAKGRGKNPGGATSIFWFGGGNSGGNSGFEGGDVRSGPVC